MLNFKSQAVQKEKINYDKAFIIEQLFADPKAIEMHVAKLKEVYKDASDSFIRTQIDNIIIKENAFNIVMSYLVTCYEFNFDSSELSEIQTRLKTQFPPETTKEHIEDLSKKLVQKGLIFNSLSSENQIDVSDEDVKKYLDQYYKSTNNSINQYLNDKNKFAEIKSIILEEKITQWIITKFKVSITIQNILNRQVPMKENTQN